MRTNRRGKRFHDPWGNKYGNREGSTIRLQYLVGQSDLSRGEHGVNNDLHAFDYSKAGEHSQDRFVRGPWSIEAIRR